MVVVGRTAYVAKRDPRESGWRMEVRMEVKVMLSSACEEVACACDKIAEPGF